ncbi:hypothetical protein KMI_03g05220 [Encephalitozoon hellem]|nr:hypothetical protein KMI_03g05220 [Encephalitozoon hellem]
MEENSNPEKKGRSGISFDLAISAFNLLVAAAQIGYHHLASGNPSERIVDISKFATSAVLLVSVLKVLYQLRRFTGDHGARKMNRIKILLMVMYLLSFIIGAGLLFTKSNKLGDLKIEDHATIVSMASLLGMVVSSGLLDFKHLPKGNYVDYLIIFSSLVLILKLATFFPPLSKHAGISDAAKWGCIVVGLVVPLIQNLLSPGSISEPVSHEDFAMFNVLSLLILVLGIAIVSSPHIHKWWQSSKVKPKIETAKVETV